MRVPILVAILGLAASGCFLEELDAAQEQLDRYGPGGAKRAAESAEAPAAGDEDAGPGVVARLRAWWDERSDAGTEDAEDGRTRQVSPIVRCEVDGEPRFMLLSECQTLGGRVLP